MPGLPKIGDEPDIEHTIWGDNVFWLECKRIDRRGRLTRPTPEQREWKLLMQKRGAMVVTLGEECAPTFEAFRDWYRASGVGR